MWNILSTKQRIGSFIPSSSMEASVSFVWRRGWIYSPSAFLWSFQQVPCPDSPWELDSESFRSFSLPDWIRTILQPCTSVGVPRAYSHLFQFFAANLADLIGFRGTGSSMGRQPPAFGISLPRSIGFVEHFRAWRVRFKDGYRNRWNRFQF